MRVAAGHAHLFDLGVRTGCEAPWKVSPAGGRIGDSLFPARTDRLAVGEASALGNAKAVQAGRSPIAVGPGSPAAGKADPSLPHSTGEDISAGTPFAQDDKIRFESL